MGRSCSIQSLSSLSVLYTSATVNTGDPLAVVDVERNASDVEMVRACSPRYSACSGVLTTERTRTLRDDGLTMREITRELDCSVATVSRYAGWRANRGG